MEVKQLNDNQRCTIAQNLRYLMDLKKITETKAAQELSIPVMTLRRLLSGETTDPRVFTLKNIADYFNVSVDSLIGESEIPSYELSKHSKPAFIPLFDWKSLKKHINTDLQNWQDWIPVTVGKNTQFSKKSFALESRPSMYPRYQQGTIFILDPELTPIDGDIVLVNLIKNNELTLRELFIDPPEWQLHPLIQGTPVLHFNREEHEIIAVVCLTLFYNR
ncbi:XRE family transcriptional regulator [Legionella sp.]|uniref:helix-turn-helix domain-containing protein n=1 Tax=Legionella sp. TaxID=459 RepID=UPI000CBF3891|nr:XRE family transcriptional regulator [Legionella sp.]PJE14246.1 MAG: peptidase S24 [Legionella sp.]